MKKLFKYLALTSMSLLLLTACAPGDSPVEDSSEREGPLKVIASFTIIQDLAREIGGDDVEIHNLVPTGTDPHEYEPLPQDIKKATDADILFYNGLNLEGGKDGWFFRMIDSVNQKKKTSLV